MMHVVQLMASPFFGGPERQMLGLARHLPADYRTTFLSFPERGLCEAFLTEVRAAGFEGRALTQNFPRLRAAVAEVADELRCLGADVVCCSGYKPDLIGWRAARRLGIPVVSVSHGWTAATWRVRAYEVVDRLALRWMDAVVCVSEAQAAKVRRAGVAETKVITIRNAVAAEAFAPPDPAYRTRLHDFFPSPPRVIVGAAGRLSPEKGFSVLIDAGAAVLAARPDVGFVIFGEGPLRSELEAQIARLKLVGRCVLAGFQPDVQKYLPHLDVGAMSSFTEGLPVILLEMCAAGLPVVSTAVGGIPEVITEGQTGRLVAPGDVPGLGCQLLGLIDDVGTRHSMGQQARERVQAEFTFAGQSLQYQELFQRLNRRALVTTRV